jgi:hypothetical protein
MSPTINLQYLLCQSSSLEELEQTARELGCIEIQLLYSALHVTLPDGERGSFRMVRDGSGFAWVPHDSAE